MNVTKLRILWPGSLWSKRTESIRPITDRIHPAPKMDRIHQNNESI